MSERQQEIIETMMPVIRTMLPKKILAEYEVKAIPFSLWASLYTRHFTPVRLEKRVKEYISFLIRADQLNYPLASDLITKMMRAPHTDFALKYGMEDFWLRGFDVKNRIDRRKRDQYDRYRFRDKMRDIELVAYMLGQLTGAGEHETTYYNMLLDEAHDINFWDRAHLARCVRTYLDLQDWWQTEGVRFRRDYPTRGAYLERVKPRIFFSIVEPA